MFDLDFSKIPVAFQVAGMLGAGLAGASIMAVFLRKALTTPPSETAQYSEMSKLAAQLADANLRVDLMGVIESARVGLENADRLIETTINKKIDAVSADFRLACKDMTDDAKRDRAGLHARIAAAEDRIGKAEQSIAQMNQRRR